MKNKSKYPYYFIANSDVFGILVAEIASDTHVIYLKNCGVVSRIPTVWTEPEFINCYKCGKIISIEEVALLL